MFVNANKNLLLSFFLQWIRDINMQPLMFIKINIENSCFIELFQIIGVWYGDMCLSYQIMVSECMCFHFPCSVCTDARWDMDQLVYYWKCAQQAVFI